MGKIISVVGWVHDAAVWSLQVGHSRRVDIEDRDHGRDLPALVRHLAADKNPHDLPSSTEQAEIRVAFAHG
jgi:hypothetical protein